MKKIYTLLFIALFLAVAADAQRTVSSSIPFIKRNHFVSAQSVNQLKSVNSTDDTLTAHFQGTPILYGSSGGGFVSGHNGYGDLAKMQLFDAVYGVTGPGVITGVLFYMGWVEGNPNSFITAKIWDNNAGEPGTILGSVNIPYSSMDTTATGYTQIGSGDAYFNGVGVFSAPIAIPASGEFWAGFSFTYASGDTVGLVTTTDGDFPDAATYTFEQWSDNTYHSYNGGTGTWQLDIAQGLFPTVSFGVSVPEVVSNDGTVLYHAFPNPVADQTTISYTLEKSSNVSFTLTDVAGREVQKIEQGNRSQGNHSLTLNTQSLCGGVYVINMHADGTHLKTRLMVTK